MKRQVVPIANLARRIPEAGRIRIGMKAASSNGKGGRPMSITHFRFTSHDQSALQQIAEMYGGDVKPWVEPKAAPGQFEVLTTAPEIRVVLPPDPLGSTPVYEQWGGGGCERRCDGVTAAILQQGPDGLEPTDVPCLCAAKGELACKITTHLSVILPEIRFAGVWRLTSHSDNAAQELPGMVEFIQQMQGQGLSYAVLAIQPRRSVSAGETHQFMVPVLGVPESVEALAAGQSRLGALPTGDASLDAPALPAAPQASEPVDVADADDEIHDAEVVDEPTEPPPSAVAGMVCSICSEPYGEDALVKGRADESKYVHKACRESAAVAS